MSPDGIFWVFIELCHYFFLKLTLHERHYNGVILEILVDHKFEWPQEGLNCKRFTCSHLTHHSISSNRLGRFGVPKFATLQQ